MSEIQVTQVNQSVFDAKSFEQAASADSSPKTPEIKAGNKISPSMKTKLKFQVDRDSNEVTVLILDAKSHEVIRTVPPEELAELTPGDLMDLSR